MAGDGEDEASKTEEASERKLEKAREEGHVPISQEVKSWFILFGALMMLWGLAPFAMRRIVRLSMPFIEHPDEIPTGIRSLQALTTETSGRLLIAVAPMMAVFLLFAAVSALVQIGFMYTPKRLEFKWDKLNVFQAMTEFITRQKIVEMLKGLAKIAAVLWGAYLVVKPRIVDMTGLPSFSVADILDNISDTLFWMLFTMVMIMFVIAFADYFYQKFSYLKKQRMTKQEVKEEYKQTEGDPQIKMRLRSIRMERFRQRMMANVPKSTVVVTNPTHFAVALRYAPEENMAAPVVTAKGQDFIALKIKEIAKENDVPIVEDPPLARALYATVEIDRQIPEVHFAAVAKVIQYVYKQQGKMPDGA